MEPVHSRLSRLALSRRLVLAAVVGVYLITLLISGGVTLINNPSPRLLSPVALFLVALLPPTRPRP